MKIISCPFLLKNHLKTLREDSNISVGFVPTMGALHEGHRTLIKQSKAENDITIVSIFINPTQFLVGEDLNKYPRRDEADKKICELSGVDILFFPSTEDIYGEDEVFIQAPKVRGYVLEGTSRPGHFSGVLSVVMKLLNITNPQKAYFGKKDAQQLNLINIMVKQMFMDVIIVAVDTVREKDGLALSSRNIYLSQEERKEALKIISSLYIGAKMVSKNILDIEEISHAMKEVLYPLEISYVAIVSRDFKAIKKVVIGDTIILVEAKVGTTRLLDNIWL